MATHIGKADVQKLADLALIDVAEEELDTVTGEIEAILGYVSEVSTLAGTEAEQQMPVLRNVLREDAEPHESGVYTDSILKQAPDTKGDYLRVKKIL
jgi:aspartyl-tRNA(Asn)/glutamyl-tRNA(Gln) amidotransferase subunit C